MLIWGINLNQNERLGMYLNLILTVIVLKAYERMNLADALTSKTYTSGSVIIQQGDPADGMYFVETGEVSVTVVGNDGSERQVRLRCYWTSLRFSAHVLYHLNFCNL